MNIKKLISLSIIMLSVIILNGCGGGYSAPSDSDNISVVKITDLRLGYLARGIILTGDDYDNIGYDIGFCNNEVTIRMIFEAMDTEGYSVGSYEIVGEEIIIYADKTFFNTLDTSDTGTLEEGKTYDNWYIGSISKKECIVEPI